MAEGAMCTFCHSLKGTGSEAPGIIFIHDARVNEIIVS